MSSFALIGAAGYVAPRHMKAMHAVGGNLKVAYDPNDSVGILDGHFPDAHFFTEFERFDRHVDKLRRRGEKIDYVSICSPNHLHDAHCRFALRSGADAICEKPLTVWPRLNRTQVIAFRRSCSFGFIPQSLPCVRSLRQAISATRWI
jgi:UDP-N-acetyl-2-amino-2-deoxyglucuronate dehydrogenase